MIRHATDDEIADAAKQIARSTVSDTRFIHSFGPFTQVGPWNSNGVHRKILLRGLELSAREVLEEAAVLTLVVDDEPVGWVAFRPPSDTAPLTVVFVHVIDLVRRRGFGRQLLQQALDFGDERQPRFSYMTRSGVALLRSHEAR